MLSSLFSSLKSFISSASNTKKALISIGLVAGTASFITFYKYWRETRTVSASDLVPDENRTAVMPPQDFVINATGYAELAQNMLANLYDYVIYLSLKKNLIPHIKELRSLHDSNSSSSLSLTCLDAGCSVGGISFRLSQQNDVSKVYGIDLSPSFIEYAKQKLNKTIPIKGLKDDIKDEHLSKMSFLCQDVSVLSQFKVNDIDIGYISMVLHELPKRIPMNILCELSRVCKYVVVLDWIGPNFPWNSAGIRNRRIEFMAGASHFAGFRHFVSLGGIEAHIKSLQKYRNNVKVKLFKKIDKETIGLYILDTVDTNMSSKI